MDIKSQDVPKLKRVLYTECNYVTENKNNDCIAVLDSGSDGTNQSIMVEPAIIFNGWKTKRTG